jgi:hypothetical protein
MRRQEHKLCQCASQSCADLLVSDAIWVESLKMGKLVSQYEKGGLCSHHPLRTVRALLHFP